LARLNQPLANRKLNYYALVAKESALGYPLRTRAPDFLKLIKPSQPKAESRFSA